VVPAGLAAITVRRTGDALAALVRPPSRTTGILGELLARRFGLEPPEVRLALQLRAGMSLADCAAEEGEDVSAVRARLRRLCAGLGPCSQGTIVAVVDRLARALPWVPAPLPGAGVGGASSSRAVTQALRGLLTSAEPALLVFADQGRSAWASTGARLTLGVQARCPGLHRRPPSLVTLARRVAGGPPNGTPPGGWAVTVDGTTTAWLWPLRPGIVAARLRHGLLPWRAFTWRLRHEVGLLDHEVDVAALAGLGHDTAAMAAALGAPEEAVRRIVARVSDGVCASAASRLADVVQRLMRVDEEPAWPEPLAPASEAGGRSRVPLEGGP
jgi:hypothetical protein